MPASDPAPALAARARRRWWRAARWAGAIFALPLALLLWGAGIEPRRVEVDEIEAFVPNLPASWDRRRFAVVADFQRGMWLNNNDTAHAVIRELVALKPEAVLFAGDFIYGTTNSGARETIPGVVETLRPLQQAGISVIAVLGNHDYGLMDQSMAPDDRLADELVGALEGVGAHVLRNQALAITGGDGTLDPIWIVGVDDAWAHRDRPQVALASVPPKAARIVLMHNPSTFKAFASGAAPLAFAGHTHGGQVRVPFTGKKSWGTWIRGEGKRIDGWLDWGAEHNRLYVTRGVGFSGIPLRFNCPPELTLVTLRR